MKHAEDLMARSMRVAPGGVHSNTRRITPQLMPKSGKGARVTTQDNKEYIDFHASFGPIILGHAYSKVTNFITEALQEQDLFGFGATEYEIRCCEKIVEHVPSAEKVLLTNSGTESTFHAIRVSRAITGRKKIIKFQGCYHGWHDYVARNMLSAKELIGKRDPGSAGMLDEAVDSTLVCRYNDLDDVEQTIKQNKDEVAAIIVEPIPHNIGCVLPQSGFLEGLRELTKQHGIVLIFDEVITGFRHGLGGYQQACGVTPDLTTLGKAIANGYPIAAVCGKAEIMDYFTTNPSGNALFAGTYNGHAVGTAAILATLDILETEPVYDHIYKLGATMRSGIQDIADRNGLPVTVKGFGSVFVPYFTRDTIENYEDLMKVDVESDLKFRRGMIEQGVLMIPLPMKRNHTMYALSQSDVDYTLEAAEKVMKAMGREA
ncbi:aspartate aminotransferase family protein [Paenibacillus mendelii]|uniref:Aspartate aminotransferase family protein n=1 Tax=Paenibacillus mendelii TaxID=206163 RepID=A0ABV6JFR7_9BACL|nr:aspartate aminotransferase family protein [Paenibacillus mendelii]MCQ6557643.1 aspartate aminotransferase family protein [Paenibacillus mendelii]